MGYVGLFIQSSFPRTICHPLISYSPITKTTVTSIHWPDPKKYPNKTKILKKASQVATCKSQKKNQRAGLKTCLNCSFSSSPFTSSFVSLLLPPPEQKVPSQPQPHGCSTPMSQRGIRQLKAIQATKTSCSSFF